MNIYQVTFSIKGKGLTEFLVQATTPGIAINRALRGERVTLPLSVQIQLWAKNMTLKEYNELEKERTDQSGQL